MTRVTNPSVPPPSQARYQVRFDVGAEGLARIGDADVVVRVDAFGVADAGVDVAAVAPAAAVLSADLRTRGAAARWILDHQVASGRRVSISVVTASGDGTFSAADVLAAGAVIDALAALGIDFTSPEAAVACAAFTGLSGAVGHLLTASVTGQELVASGTLTAAEVRSCAVVDADDTPVVLRAPSA
jgi:phosphosulfolactate phosphohydrolase-like enzyme